MSREMGSNLDHLCLWNALLERGSEEGEKHVKYTSVIANCIMLDNVIEINAALNTLAKKGALPTIDELAALSNCGNAHFR